MAYNNLTLGDFTIHQKLRKPKPSWLVIVSGWSFLWLYFPRKGTPCHKFPGKQLNSVMILVAEDWRHQKELQSPPMDGWKFGDFHPCKDLESSSTGNNHFLHGCFKFQASSSRFSTIKLITSHYISSPAVLPVPHSPVPPGNRPRPCGNMKHKEGSLEVPLVNSIK